MKPLTGTWYDMPALNGAKTLWAGLNRYHELQGVSIPLRFIGSEDITSAVEGSLNETRTHVLDLLQQTVFLASLRRGPTVSPAQRLMTN
ncbi:hypothetical protein N7508_009472 [Penicillium antarcticum]|uniref:uncharacterized protein n=1 Tax=Penicillium antarcticum TaxID=416450 RepID=UPI0023A473E6|nr:uncharacterized protein N7508_009472 [Penicillium antarcticum]KAJ5294651.1 hypothetical protein N7508_009472 [Penicillium antarcticum]